VRIVYQRCCGMDVHKDSVTACLLLIDEYGELRMEKRCFRTMTRDLKEMATWLASLSVEAIAAPQEEFPPPQSTVGDILMCGRVRYRGYGALFLRRIGLRYPSSLTPSNCKKGPASLPRAD
jgi:hypothetical protein